MLVLVSLCSRESGMSGAAKQVVSRRRGPTCREEHLYTQGASRVLCSVSAGLIVAPHTSLSRGGIARDSTVATSWCLMRAWREGRRDEREWGAWKGMGEACRGGGLWEGVDGCVCVSVCVCVRVCE